jgi:protease I
MPKKVLMIIAPMDFRDEEYFDTRKVLEESGAEITVANSTGQASKSMFGKIVNPDKNFYDIDSKDYDAIVFVGGQGTPVYFDNKQAQNLAKEFNNSGKIVAAICIAPVILARAGILSGKKATVFPSGKNDINAVGTYTGSSVEKDGNIITGSGPEAANEFGRRIVEALK